MGDTNELNLDDLEDMDMDLIKCTFDEYFKKSVQIINPNYAQGIKETIKMFQLNPADTLYELSKIDMYLYKLLVSKKRSTNINIADIYDYAEKRQRN